MTASLRFAAAILIGAVAAAGCTRYQQKPVPIRLPSAYPNAVEAFGATVAAEVFADSARAKEAFGFDILGAGVLPVQVVFDHQGSDPIQIVADQTFLIDPQQQLWNILSREMTYSRLEKSSEWGEIAPEAGKGAVLGAAAGAIVGAAVGIVTGSNVLSTTGKGAAVGGAGGAVLGGAKGYEGSDTRSAIREDLRTRSLENKPIPPQSLSQGVLFFPAEAQAGRLLRIQLRNTTTGETKIVNLGL